MPDVWEKKTIIFHSSGYHSALNIDAPESVKVVLFNAPHALQRGKYKKIQEINVALRFTSYRLGEIRIRMMPIIRLTLCQFGLVSRP